MTPRQIKITEKVLSLIDWLEAEMGQDFFKLPQPFRSRLIEKLYDIKLESFAAEQLEEEQCEHHNCEYGITKFGSKYFFCYDCKQFFNDLTLANNK